jgi:glucose/arabinose dehydrogenase
VRSRARAAALGGLLLLAACGGGDDASAPSMPTATGPGPCGATPVSGTPALKTTRIASGFREPVDVQSAPGDCRLFVVEQAGRIRVMRNGAVLPAPFLDIAGRIASGGERGLLGLAFHPRFAENGRFFIDYTDPNGDTHVAELRATGDAADAGSERLVLFQRQPFANHNGGGLAFGPDGFLYVGLGDGGSAGDPQRNGQSLGTFLGKLLRIDVDSAAPYAVPRDNPFVGRAGASPEIWAFGLRNPWRFAFDRATGDLLIGDVGQGAVEEIDVASRRGGDNFGWNVTEGSSCYQPSSGCSTAGITMPVAEYRHDGGACSVTGGVVYRGTRMPFLQGTYFYSDYCRPFVRSFRLTGGVASDARDRTSELGAGLNSVTSFGVDADGEVYIVDHDGEIYRVEPAV